MQWKFISNTILCLALGSVEPACKTRVPTTSSPKLVGGTEVPESHWPEVRQLNLFKKDGGAFKSVGKCTGTFVDGHAVLTSAHCLCGKDLVFAKITWWRELVSERMAVHPNYRCGEAKQPATFDIGLVWVKAKPHEPTGPMPFLMRAGRDLGAETVTMIGYGLSRLEREKNIFYPDKVVLAEQKPVRGNDSDDEYFGKRVGFDTYENERSENAYQFRANFDASSPVDGPRDEAATASGDSGGPLVIMPDRKIIGVASKGGASVWFRPTVKTESVFTDLPLLENRKFLSDHGIWKE